MRFLLFIIFLFGCHNQSIGQPKELFHADFATRELIIDSVFKTGTYYYITDSTVYNRLFSQYLSKAKQENDDKLIAHLELEKYKHLFQTYNNNKAVDIDGFMKLIKRFGNENDKYMQAAAMQAYANFLGEQKKDYGLVFEYYLEAFDKYENLSVAEFPHKLDYIYTLGLVYYQFQDYRNAIKYFTLGVKQSDDMYGKYTGMVNTLALSYRELGKLDSAMYYFRKLSDYANSNHIDNWILISRLNIGHTYLLQNNYALAKSEMIFSHDYAIKTNQKYGISESAICLAEIAFHEKEYDKAEKLITEACSVWKEKFGTNWHNYRMEVARDAYNILADIYRNRGNYKQAYLYRDTAFQMKDSLDKQFNAVQVSNGERKVMMAKYSQEKEKLQFEKKKQALIRNGLLLSISLVTIIALMFINNQKLRRKKLEADKKNAEDKLIDFTKTIHQKTALIDHVSEELNRYKAQQDESEHNDILIKLQQSTILTDDEWDDFRNMFEQVHGGFLKRLRDKMPDLTPAETRFMVLSKLKLTPKDMANILGVGPSAIRKYRYRLRNKLNLPEDGSIDEVVEMI